MNFDYASRATVTLGLLILLIFVSNLYFVFSQDLLHMPPIYSDQVSVYQKRFESLKQALPRRALLGYIGDRDPQANRRYYLTRYALAPLVIASTDSLPVIVGDFHDLDSARVIPKHNRLVLVQEFGDGVQLFQQREDK